MVQIPYTVKTMVQLLLGVPVHVHVYVYVQCTVNSLYSEVQETGLIFHYDTVCGACTFTIKRGFT